MGRIILTVTPILVSAICLLFTVGAKAGTTDEPSALVKLQIEYHKKAQSKIGRINKRYKDKLEYLYKKKGKSGSPAEIQAIQKEIRELRNPALLLQKEKGADSHAYFMVLMFRMEN